MSRFTIRPHHFIDGALWIVDTAPTHPGAATRDWTEASASIVAKVARDVEQHGSSLSDLIAIAESRTVRLRLAKHRRKIRQLEADGLWHRIPWTASQKRLRLSFK